MVCHKYWHLPQIIYFSIIIVISFEFLLYCYPANMLDGIILRQALSLYSVKKNIINIFPNNVDASDWKDSERTQIMQSWCIMHYAGNSYI